MALIWPKMAKNDESADTKTEHTMDVHKEPYPVKYEVWRRIPSPVRTKTEETLQQKRNRALYLINDYMEKHNLSLASSKSKEIVLKGSRKENGVYSSLGEMEIIS